MVIPITAFMQSKAGLSSLFDASFHDEGSVESGGVKDEDDLSVVSKSVVDESKKNVVPMVYEKNHHDRSVSLH